MRGISDIELKEVLRLHELWLKGDGTGLKANLNYTDLSDLDLYGVNLKCADLFGADLSGIDLRYADLVGADLRSANLSGANLIGSKLNRIKYSSDTSFFALQCPEEGSFIGYKKCGKTIVTLKITKDAKRSSSTSRKCRCSKAVVLDIENIKTKEKIEIAKSRYDSKFVYEVGKTVEVKDFNEDRWEECTTGIHFFITKDEAINY